MATMTREELLAKIKKESSDATILFPQTKVEAGETPAATPAPEAAPAVAPAASPAPEAAPAAAPEAAPVTESAKTAEPMTEANATNVKKAEDTIQNIKAPIVPNGTEIDDKKSTEAPAGANSELPTQKDVQKDVNAAVPPIVDADKNGVSKNGGEKPLTHDSIEAEKKKEDNKMKDVVNVSDRTYGESSDVSKELSAALKEAEGKIASLQAQLGLMNEVCTKAMQEKNGSLKEFVTKVAVRAEQIESALKAEAVEAAKRAAKFESFSKKAMRLSSKLLEAVKAKAPEAKFAIHESKVRRAIKAL